MEEEYKTSSNFHQCINIVDSKVPCAPPRIQCRDDSGIHEFDRSMENISVVLAQYLMVDRLISKVRVKITRSRFTAYIDKRHHGISDDILERKWVVVLDKAKWTLQSTTQDNVRSALKPLTLWYRTGFLLQRLRQLNCRFYTDTLFAKEKSIVGNTCDQILTYG